MDEKPSRSPFDPPAPLRARLLGAAIYTLAAGLMLLVAAAAAFVAFCCFYGAVMELGYIERGKGAMELMGTAMIMGGVAALLTLIGVPMWLWPKCDRLLCKVENALRL